MKTILRIIGTIVVIVVLAGFVLFKLNEKGFVSGALSQWIASVSQHITGISDDTKDFLLDEGYIHSTETPSPAEPTGEPAATPGE